MVWICFFLCHLSLAISTLAINPSQIKVFPENGGISGVFLASLQPVQNKNPPYAFNASQAREVCLMLKVIIATRAQVEEAYRNGLETCRYGWVDEKIAVLPRISPSKTCGQNRVGVIPWRSVPTRSFDAFCFNSSDIRTEETVMTTKIPTNSRSTTTASSSTKPVPPNPPTSPQPKTTKSVLTSPLPLTTQSAPTSHLPLITQSAPTSHLPLTTQSAPTSHLPLTTQSAPTSHLPLTTQSAPTSRLPLTTQSAPTSRLPLTTQSAPTSHLPLTTQSAPTSRLPLTTQSAPTSHSPPSTQSPPRSSSSAHTTSTSLSSATSRLIPLTSSPVHPISVLSFPANTESLHPGAQDIHGSGSPLGVVPTALLAAIGILFLLAIVIALWYYKMNRSRTVPFWKNGQHKDDFETEVWENLCQKEVKEQHTEMELGGISNGSKEISLEEDSDTRTDSP